MIEFRFFCKNCQQDFKTETTSRTKQIICPNCQKSYAFEQIIRSTYKIKRELDKLAKKFRIYYYARVEFEQDFRELYNTDDFFDIAVKIMKNASRDMIFPARFDIVAYQFKTRDAERFLLHSCTLNPRIYNIPAAPNVYATFSDAIHKSHLYIFAEDSIESELTLASFSQLALHSIRYNTLYEQFVFEHKSFFFPSFLFW